MIIHAELIAWLTGRQWLVENGQADRFHAVFADPPYALTSIAKRFGKVGSAPAKPGKDGAFARLSRGFMSQTWDGFATPDAYQDWCATWARPMLSFVYPGAVGLFFGGARTAHRLACGLEDAGWEVHDTIMYLYGSGNPLSHNLEGGYANRLKPAYEPIIVARAPRLGWTYEQLLTKFGVGSLNIDGARLNGHAKQWDEPRGGFWQSATGTGTPSHTNEKGRWPANVILDDEAAARLDVQSGDLVSGGSGIGRPGNDTTNRVVYGKLKRVDWESYNDSGGASRFFYTAKAGDFEKQAGLDGYCTHPTVKSITLTEYLARLILPPTHIGERRLLVPFAGVGSEILGAHLAGWSSITGIEMTDEYIPQAEARLKWWSQFKHYEQAREFWQSSQRGRSENVKQEQAGQLPLFS